MADVVELTDDADGYVIADAIRVASFDPGEIAVYEQPDLADPVELVSTAPVANGTWHNVVTTYDPGNRMAIYLDGVLSGELTTDVTDAFDQ